MSINNPLEALTADWMEIHTVTRFQEKVDPQFEWKGPGWYPKVNGHDTLYISEPFLLDVSPANHYRFYVFNDRDPRQMARLQFSRILGDVVFPDPRVDGLWEGADSSPPTTSTTVQNEMIAEVRKSGVLLARFFGPDRENHAAEFIGTLPEYKTGCYDLVVWPNPDYSPPPICQD